VSSRREIGYKVKQARKDVAIKKSLSKQHGRLGQDEEKARNQEERQIFQVV
jgi:hypothetical protein